ncbi:MAG: cytochrome c [Puniceicoccaceae bacterium]|nr:MAG: cytochrome c [Puniceicoccaceae bacterium]
MNDDPKNPPPGPEDNDPRLEQGAVSDEGIQKIHAQLLREKEEPTEGFAPIPIFMLFLFSGVIFFAGVYIAQYSGGWDPLNYDERVGVAAVTDAPAAVDPLVLGRRLYTQQCVACHGANGQGVAGVFPPLVGTSWVVGAEERLIRVLLHGLVGEIEVLGNTYNANMPAFGPNGARWNDQQIAAVATFIRQEWGNDAPAIDPETVAEVRSATAGRTSAWTNDELEPYAN